MLKAFDFCIPTKSTIVRPALAGLHEVKYDGLSLSTRWNSTLAKVRVRIPGPQ
jgi:hypothetical protein